MATVLATIPPRNWRDETIPSNAFALPPNTSQMTFYLDQSFSLGPAESLSVAIETSIDNQLTWKIITQLPLTQADIPAGGWTEDPYFGVSFDLVSVGVTRWVRFIGALVGTTRTGLRVEVE